MNKRPPNQEPGTSDQESVSSDHLGYLLTAYLFDNLSPAGKSEVESHLVTCEACRDQLAALRATLGLAEAAFNDDGKTYVFETRRRQRILEAATLARFGFFNRQAAAFRFRTWKELAVVAAILLVVVSAVMTMFISAGSKSIMHFDDRESVVMVTELKPEFSSSIEPATAAKPSEAAPSAPDTISGFAGPIVSAQSRPAGESYARSETAVGGAMKESKPADPNDPRTRSFSWAETPKPEPKSELGATNFSHANTIRSTKIAAYDQTATFRSEGLVTTLSGVAAENNSVQNRILSDAQKPIAPTTPSSPPPPPTAVPESPKTAEPAAKAFHYQSGERRDPFSAAPSNAPVAATPPPAGVTNPESRVEKLSRQKTPTAPAEPDWIAAGRIGDKRLEESGGGGVNLNSADALGVTLDDMVVGIGGTATPGAGGGWGGGKPNEPTLGQGHGAWGVRGITPAKSASLKAEPSAAEDQGIANGKGTVNEGRYGLFPTGGGPGGPAVAAGGSIKKLDELRRDKDLDGAVPEFDQENVGFGLKVQEAPKRGLTTLSTEVTDGRDLPALKEKFIEQRNQQLQAQTELATVKNSRPMQQVAQGEFQTQEAQEFLARKNEDRGGQAFEGKVQLESEVSLLKQKLSDAQKDKAEVERDLSRQTQRIESLVAKGVPVVTIIQEDAAVTQPEIRPDPATAAARTGLEAKQEAEKRLNELNKEVAQAEENLAQNNSKTIFLSSKKTKAEFESELSKAKEALAVAQSDEFETASKALAAQNDQLAAQNAESTKGKESLAKDLKDAYNVEYSKKPAAQPENAGEDKLAETKPSSDERNRATKNKPALAVAGAVIVPPEILDKAQLGDHFETINPNKPDTQSAFGNPDATMFHKVGNAEDTPVQLGRVLNRDDDGEMLLNPLGELANSNDQNDQIGHQRRERAALEAAASRERESDQFKARVGKMVEQVKDLNARGEHQSATNMATQVLKIDPLNAEAEGLKNKSRGLANRKEHQGVDYKAQYHESLLNVDEASVSTGPLIVYPPNWDEISKRSPKAGAEVTAESALKTNKEAFLEDVGVEFQGLDPNVLLGDVRRLGAPTGLVQPRIPGDTTVPNYYGFVSSNSDGKVARPGTVGVDNALNFFDSNTQLPTKGDQTAPPGFRRELYTRAFGSPSMGQDQSQQLLRLTPLSTALGAEITQLKSDERTLRAYNVLRAEAGTGKTLSFAEFCKRPAPIAPPVLSDDGLDEDAYIEKHGTRPFVDAKRDHLSTFSMDVDTASYTRARSQLRDNNLPDPAAVRVEEFVNYFKQPYTVAGEEAFGVFAEAAPSPFSRGGGVPPPVASKSLSTSLSVEAPELQLLKIGIKSRDPKPGERKPAMLTFAVDTSGSMTRDDRLDMLRAALGALVEQLQPEDAVSIVAFADQAQVLLPRTQARQKQRILDAIGALRPDGGTNVEAGLALAYRIADESFTPDAVNRVILCSDGVANVGAKGPEAVLKTVKVFAARGIDLSSVGFGMGKYNDEMMMKLADNGNGSCHFVDTLDEARRIFTEQLPPHLSALARDAKIQVDFNPAVVARYRLLGYEKRKIADKDFRNDAIDAGEVQHSTLVTALYEIERAPAARGPLGKVFLRWKDAGHRHLPVIERNFPLDESMQSASADSASPQLRFLACVARFAELLRDSPWTRNSSYADVLEQLDRLPADFKQRDDCKEVRELVQRAQTLSITQWSKNL